MSPARYNMPPGIGVGQPNSGVDYPLVGVPSADIRFLLADLQLTYDDPADYDSRLTPFKLPFRIWWLHGVGNQASAPPAYAPAPAHAAEILIVDARNCVVFDSTGATSFLSKAWGTDLHIYGWETADAVCAVVRYNNWDQLADYGIDLDYYSQNIHPQQATLDARTLLRRPRRVKSLQVVLTTLQATAIQLNEGFNVGLTHTTDVTPGGRSRQRVAISAVPRSGAGIFPGCAPAVRVVKRINSVAPTPTGDFYLAASDCYYLRQPATRFGNTAVATPAMLEFGNDCVPCCDCSDYVSLANYLNKTRNRYQTAGEAASGVRDAYHTSRGRWCVAKQCFESHPLRLAVQPQVCPFLDVAGQFSNQTKDCVGPLELEFTFNVDCAGGSATAPASSAACEEPVGTEVPGFTFIRGLSYRSPRRSSAVERYSLSGTWPVFRVYYDAVESLRDVWTKFRLMFNCCGVDPAGDPLVVQVRLRAYLDGQLVQIPGGDYDTLTCDTDVRVIAQECAQAVLRCPAVADDYRDLSICRTTTDTLCPPGESPEAQRPLWWPGPIAIPVE